MMKRLSNFVRRLRDDTEGLSSVEFVVLFPAAMMIFLSTFEAGMYLTRQVFLDRGLDLAVREIRLSTGTVLTHEDLRTQICDHATLIPDCEEAVRIEMIRFDPRVNFTVPDRIDCVDRPDQIEPVDTTGMTSEEAEEAYAEALAEAYANVRPIDEQEPRSFQIGDENEIMFIRVCALFDPRFPSSVFAADIVGTDGKFAMVTQSAYVTEPQG